MSDVKVDLSESLRGAKSGRNDSASDDVAVHLVNSTSKILIKIKKLNLVRRFYQDHKKTFMFKTIKFSIFSSLLYKSNAT